MIARRDATSSAAKDVREEGGREDGCRVNRATGTMSRRGAGAPASGAAGGKQASEQCYVCVVLPNDEYLTLSSTLKTTGHEIFVEVCDTLHVKEPQLFGLSVVANNEHIFMDLEQKLTKYCPKEWKKESSRGADFGPPLTLFFKVQFYVENGKLISDKTTRHYYYLQMRKQVLSSRCPQNEEAYFLLAAYALQADLGNYHKSKHVSGYFQPKNYFPEWVVRKRGMEYLLRHVPGVHREQTGISPEEAELRFVREASRLADVAVHYYRLQRNKKESEASLLLGVMLKGIQIFQEAGETRHLLYDFPWFNVGKLTFLGKKFELEPDGLPSARKLTYYTGCPTRSRHLLRLLSETHRLFLSTQQRLLKLQRLEDKEAKLRYRESYISDTLELELETLEGAPRSHGGSGGTGDKRWSGHSGASRASTHTSGIEADTRQRLADRGSTASTKRVGLEAVEVSVDEPQQMVFSEEMHDLLPSLHSGQEMIVYQEDLGILVAPAAVGSTTVKLRGTSTDCLPQVVTRAPEPRVSSDRHSQSLDDVRLYQGDRPLAVAVDPDVSQSYTFGCSLQGGSVTAAGCHGGGGGGGYHAASRGERPSDKYGFGPLHQPCLVKRASNCLSLDLIGGDGFLEFVV
ncbi:FERM domain-containing protein 6-like isoform X1 [Petromyzon marinus]|uniref:FERM domain-containing protein 6-like isoform X1 n=1 Tax=Petromyzon marinus TaxID=7757 RepID=UPI003F71B021